MKYDNVNKPSHYIEGRKYEPIKVIKDWGLNFNLGNTVKYISRAGRKDVTKTIEDLEKARFYLNAEIEYLKDNEKLISTPTNPSNIDDTANVNNSAPDKKDFFTYTYGGDDLVRTLLEI